MQRRLAAVFAADVVGYSRIMVEDEAGTLPALRAHRADLFDPEVARNGGRIVKLMDDGAFVEFPSVVDAVECALAIQQSPTLREGPIRLRIGINLGDIVAEDNDIYGDGVNLAARLEAAAEPGGICVSAVVHDQIRRKVDARFVSLGPTHLKNFDEPIEVWAWSPPADWSAAVPSGALPLPDKPSIAVLPFNNLSGDPEQEYFSNGITEDIITKLSRFRTLFVIARNSTFTLKGHAVDVKEVGRRLGVAYVVEGSVRKAGNRVRVSVQLVEAATGNHIWAERYDRVLEDIFEVQDEVVATIPESLGQSLHDRAVEQSRSRPASGLTAYDHLLRGRAVFWSYRLVEALGHLERALSADPHYAAAHAMLALLYNYIAYVPSMPLTASRGAKSTEHAEAALRLDDRDPIVHAAAAIAFTFTLGGDKARELRHSDTSIALNPHEFEVIFDRLHVLRANGRDHEALT